VTETTDGATLLEAAGDIAADEALDSDTGDAARGNALSTTDELCELEDAIEDVTLE
jgi:hypothetical protein